MGTPTDTIEYGYDYSEWGQLLSSYDGHTLYYDSDDGGYSPSMSHSEKYYMMWDRGHKLAYLYSEQSLYRYTDYYYSYDANGMRTKQTIIVSDDEIEEYQTSVYEYTYNGSLLTRMVYRGTEDRYTMDFRYDANGTPLSVYFTHIAYWDGGMYTCCDEVYYYITNLQGDVIAIVDCWGDIYATYTYDAWGRPLSVESYCCIGDVNPLRYRGYVYDIDTGFYYLQSRYYDPVKGRFISPDSYISTGQGILGNNMFAYCGNNPVLNYDPSGGFFFTALGAVAGFIGGAIAGALSGQSGGELLETAMHSAAGGAIGGAGVDTALLLIGSFGTALPVVALAGGVAFVAGGAGNAYTTYATSNGTASDAQMTASFLIGGVANVVSLGTSLGAVSSTVEGLFVSGMNSLTSNAATGAVIATMASVATSVVTSTVTTPSPVLPTTPSQNVGTSIAGRRTTPSTQANGITATLYRKPRGIVVPRIGGNIRVG